MSKGIKLHKEHGLNPTVPVCFWCGKDKNQIALLGAAFDGEAPKSMLLDYDPCDTCQQQWEQGQTVIEASDHPQRQNQAAMQEGVYPTGRAVTITNMECVPEEMRKHKIVFFDEELFEEKFGEVLRAASKED